MRNITVQFRSKIAELEKEQKALKERANCKGGGQDWHAQSDLMFSKNYMMFVNYTAYYIIKHDLFNKGVADTYIEETIKKARRVFSCSGGRWPNIFKKDVSKIVCKYEEEYTNEQEAIRTGE